MSEAGSRLYEELMRFRPEGLTANGWAVKAGVSRTIWADLRRHGNPSRRTLEKLLAAAGTSLAEFEALRVLSAGQAHSASEPVLAETARNWRAGPLPPVPLFVLRLAGDFGEPGSGVELHSLDRSQSLGRVDRPAAMAGDREAYAVMFEGQAMWPRFRAGRRLLVSPAANPRIGDDMLVELSPGRVLVGELVSRSAKRIELRQFNPPVSFSIKATEVGAIHKILGEAI